ncbi:MAG: serine hydrolase [Promethearchaeota archaeon]|jgi:CubicO group peptidase (beta-lactamase class C family)
MNETQIEMLEQEIVELMREFKIPGFAIGIVKEGKPFFARGFGARNLEKNLPFTKNTLFGIGSISKSFTAMAIMQLVEQGKINLQDPMNKYLNIKLGDNSNPIKICHMLSHSSGIPELDGNITAIARQLGSIDRIIAMSSWNDFLLHLNGAASEVFDKPEKFFFYNNDMFTCAGLIIEKLTGMDFYEYIKNNILNPLQMNRSTYLKEDFEKDKDILTGYLPSEEKKPYKATEHPFDKFVYAPGGLLSSVKEMQNYIIMLINNGKFNDSEIIQKSSIEELWRPYIKTPYGAEDAWYCLGWITEKDFLGHQLVHHGGNIATSTAFLAIIPEQKMGVIVGANSDASGVIGAIARKVLGILLDKDINKAAPFLNTHKKLKTLTGKYKTYKEIQTIEISLDNGILFLKLEDPIGPEPTNLPLTLENLEELKFYVPVAYPNQEIKVQFFVDEEAKKIDLTIDRYFFHKI